MDTLAIAEAIADRFDGLTATYGGVTESLVATPTALLPNQVTAGPVILVFPFADAELGYAVSRRRTDTLTYTVRLFRDPLDVPTRMGWLYAWYDAMRDKVGQKMGLDLAYVAWAEPATGRVEVDGFTYAGRLLDVAEIGVNVRLDEVVATLAS